MQIQMLKLDQVFPYEKNPRKNDEAVDKVAASIREFGFRQPIVVDADHVIIAGHTRLEASKRLGLTNVPVVVADDLSEEQVRAYRLADNKTAEFSGWDFDLLNGELFEINDIDMAAFGFDMNAFTDGMAEAEDDDYDLDAADEHAEKRVQRGQVWVLGEHRLMCGDSTDQESVAELMGGQTADMVFTDPPWNVNYGSVKKGNAMGYKPRTILNDFMGTEEFRAFMFSAFQRMNEASKAGACTYVVMGSQEWGNLMLTLAQNDYHWSSTIIWNKDSLILSRKDYHTKYEPIWYGWKEGRRLHPLKDRTQSDVWDIPRPKRSDEHPTMKPVDLVARAVINSSDRGNNVLDLFGGSGTTLIACEQLNRKCYMMELDPHYCDVIIDRWEEYTGKKARLLDGEETDMETEDQSGL